MVQRTRSGDRHLAEWQLTACVRARQRSKTKAYACEFIHYGVVSAGRLFQSYHTHKIMKNDTNSTPADSFVWLTITLGPSNMCKNLKAITNLKTVYFISFHFKVNCLQSMHEISFLLKSKRFFFEIRRCSHLKHNTLHKVEW